MSKNAITVVSPVEITETVYTVAMGYLIMDGGDLTNDEIRYLYTGACWTKLANGN
jgi:hypothetical protein